MTKAKTMKQTKLGGQKPASRKTTKKGVKFIEKHLAIYGLKIGTRNATTSQAETVVCRFCGVFGREKSSTGSKKKARAATTIPKFFTCFRTDLFQQHLDGQHPTKLSAYTTLTSENERDQFFETPDIPFVETLEAVFESEDMIMFTLSSDIVDAIVGGLLFHPDDVTGHRDPEPWRALRKKEASTVTEKRPSRFRLCVRFPGRGASFRMASKLMDDTKEETCIGRYGGCNEGVVARYARVVCAVSLQKLSRCLAAAWTFSLALDCGTHQGSSCVDVRCRFYQSGAVHNYHLLAIPLYDHHTAANIFAVVQQFLDALVPQWRYQILGVATNGAATMVGKINGLVTLIEKEVKHKITRVWCGLHQLDLKIQIVFQQALNETYLSKLADMIVINRTSSQKCKRLAPKLRKQDGCQCTAWPIGSAKMDLKCGHILLRNACAPNLVWWIFLYALREVAREANAMFVSLQGLSTLVKQQDDRFSGLVEKLLSLSGAEGPLPEASVMALDPLKYEINGSFVISHEAAMNYVSNLDLWVCTSLPLLRNAQKTTVVNAVARMYILAISSIHELTQTNHHVPLVTPKEIATSTMVELAAAIEGQHDRLLQNFGEEGIDQIGQDFKLLTGEYNSKKPIRAAIDNLDHHLACFQDMWQLGDASSRFPALASFCGGLATVFPNTATVESDFSLIGCAKTDKRASLTDLALEGILHCKQWQRVSSLAQ